jgi:hypothetical protein
VQPELDGRRCIDRFLRLRLGAAAGRRRSRSAGPGARLAQGEPVEVAGYLLARPGARHRWRPRRRPRPPCPSTGSITSLRAGTGAPPRLARHWREGRRRPPGRLRRRPVLAQRRTAGLPAAARRHAGCAATGSPRTGTAP